MRAKYRLPSTNYSGEHSEFSDSELCWELETGIVGWWARQNNDDTDLIREL